MNNPAGGAFEYEMLPYLNSLYRTSLRIVHDSAIAAKCVEQTYNDAARRFVSGSPKREQRVWLFGILFQKLHRRRHQPGPRRFSTGTSPDNPVLSALDGLPAPIRSALLLADVEEFTMEEISRILNVAVPVVESRLAEGRERLWVTTAQGAPLA